MEEKEEERWSRGEIKGDVRKEETGKDETPREWEAWGLIET